MSLLNKSEDLLGGGQPTSTCVQSIAPQNLNIPCKHSNFAFTKFNSSTFGHLM